MSGTDHLRQQLVTIGESLRAFEDPTVADLPGLRLMHETLRERQQHIARTIERNDTCSVTLDLAGAGTSGAVPAAVLVGVLAPLAAAVEIAARDHVRDWSPAPPDDELRSAASLHVAELHAAEDVSLLVTRRPGPLAAQLADPADGAPVAEHAIVAVTRALQRATSARDAPPAAGPLVDLATLLSARSVMLEWSVRPAVLEPLDVRVDAVGWRRLLANASP